MTVHYGAWLILLFAIVFAASLQRGAKLLALACLAVGVAIFWLANMRWFDAALLFDWRRYRSPESHLETEQL